MRSRVARLSRATLVLAWAVLVAACTEWGYVNPLLPRIDRLDVVSPTQNLKPGDAVQLSVVGWDKDLGALRDLSPIAWSSSAPAVATVSSNGLLSALSAGVSVISATFKNPDEAGGRSVTGSLTVTVAQPVTMSITMSAPTLDPKVGDHWQLKVVVRDQFGDVIGDAKVAWTSSNMEAGAISETGVLQAVAPGTFVVSATFDGVSDRLTFVASP